MAYVDRQSGTSRATSIATVRGHPRRARRIADLRPCRRIPPETPGRDRWSASMSRSIHRTPRPPQKPTDDAKKPDSTITAPDTKINVQTQDTVKVPGYDRLPAAAAHADGGIGRGRDLYSSDAATLHAEASAPGQRSVALGNHRRLSGGRHQARTHRHHPVPRRDRHQRPRHRAARWSNRAAGAGWTKRPATTFPSAPNSSPALTVPAPRPSIPTPVRWSGGYRNRSLDRAGRPPSPVLLGECASLLDWRLAALYRGTVQIATFTAITAARISIKVTCFFAPPFRHSTTAPITSATAASTMIESTVSIGSH